MPRKSKEELKDNVINSTNKTSTSKSSTTSKVTNRKNSTKKTEKSTTSSASTSKKVEIKKISAKKTTEKKITPKKENKKNKTDSKTSTSTAVLSNIEYYDLPYRYNETAVRILAQTPNMLFIYWDISDEDRKTYIEKYGENFFNNTKPILKITNKTMNYSFEVEINDFANSWYLPIKDADCDYSVELGRKPIEYNVSMNNYIYIVESNDMQMPNNHILFDKLGKSVFFKNIKNNFVEEKDVSCLSYIKNLGKVCTIYDMYKELYQNEIDLNELSTENIRLNLSSSNSSTFK